MLYSCFYVNPKDLQAYIVGEVGAVGSTLGAGPKALLKAQERQDRITTRQMRIFDGQWAGLELLFDFAKCQSNQEMAAAIWRNLLGAGGGTNSTYRRAVNLVGGEAVSANIWRRGVRRMMEGGVHDFAPDGADKYLTYPEVMLGLTTKLRRPISFYGYVRRELSRLEKSATNISCPVNGRRSNLTKRKYRRVVNLVGGAEAINVNKLELEKESMPDDENGVDDLTLNRVDKCLTYPEVMLGLTDKYLRYQLARLKKVGDDEIVSGAWEKLKLGRSKS
ncbi:hypothetical protein BKA70DRAFT_1233491 [Coprinopsis sp. MPI-PUGE-AT-0042]|nr:hypothetical protein BKA70DRAFT_1233491 [Coprinopsis sp. MPI-PUGE-AT-0042]